MNGMKVIIVSFMLICMGYNVFAQYTANQSKLELDLSEKPVFPKLQIDLDGTKTPLWDREENTSYWILSIDGKRYNMNEVNWLRGNNGSEGMLYYETARYFVEQEVEFLEGRQYGVITFRFVNKLENDVVVRVSLLLDTSIGDKLALPFFLPNGKNIEFETELKGENIPDWIQLREDPAGTLLSLMFGGEDGKQPYRILLANYFRLNSMGLDLDIREDMNFKTLHSSREDKALLLEYEVDVVNGGEHVEIQLFIGISNNAPSHPPSGTASKNTIQENRYVDILHQQHMEALNSMLDNVQDILDGKVDLNEDIISDIEDDLAKEEQLRAEYENQ